MISPAGLSQRSELMTKEPWSVLGFKEADGEGQAKVKV